MVLPAPLRPMMPTTSPCFTSKETSFSAQMVSLEMVVLSGVNRCLYVITEECYVDGEKLVDRSQTESGRISERFEKIRNVVERYENWCAYWKEKERKETEWTT
mgnify:CR=1 FL=1